MKTASARHILVESKDKARPVQRITTGQYL